MKVEVHLTPRYGGGYLTEVGDDRHIAIVSYDDDLIEIARRVNLFDELVAVLAAIEAADTNPHASCGDVERAMNAGAALLAEIKEGAPSCST